MKPSNLKRTERRIRHLVNKVERLQSRSARPRRVRRAAQRALALREKYTLRMREWQASLKATV